MNTLAVSNIQLETFGAEAGLEGGTPLMRLRGNADMAAFEPFTRFTSTFHEESVRLGAPQAVIDLRALEFMSSSCFKALVTWVMSIQQLESARHYPLRFVLDPEKRWQRRSLMALTALSPELVQIQEG